MWPSLQLALILLLLRTAFSDISHFLQPDHAVFQHFPFQFAFQQPTLPALYGPPQAPQAPVGYPNPMPTQSPVAPTQSTTTEFTLPEIVENRVNFIPLQSQYLPPAEDRPNYESPKPPNQSYYYPRPISVTSSSTVRPSPIVVVEPSESLPSYQGYDYNAPQSWFGRPSTPAPVYLPPPPALIAAGTSVEEAAIVDQIDAAHSLRVHVKDMRCLQHSPSGYFRATLKLDSFIAAAPTLDNDSNDKRCELKLSRSHLLVNISADDFTLCGVQSCGNADLCLRLRFPAIRGMRTVADAIVTLHCKSQERVATKTHALKIGVANDVQSRSVGTYAHGGVQNPMRTQIELLRRSQNGFTRHLEANGGAVQLGEDLLLRAHVQPGDGWNYTKLSDVSLQRISSSGELLNAANLVTADGCVNPSMQRICNQSPTYDPPLGHKLQFKAVMFHGMQSGEELVLSMRITACLEEQDCFVSQQQCGNRIFSNTGRRRRDTDPAVDRRIKKQTEISEISRISFRVIIDDIELSRDDGDGTMPNTIDGSTFILRARVLILASSLGFVALIVILGVIATWKLKR